MRAHHPMISAVLLAAPILIGCFGDNAPTAPGGGQPAIEASRAVLNALGAEANQEPDVVLLAARAYLHLTLIDPSHEESTRGLLDRLEEMTVRPGVPGWGLSYAWDAFGDGSVNPQETIYSYTTAAAALTFLDAFEVLGDVKYLDRAAEAEQTLRTATCCWEDGPNAAIWYSDQPADSDSSLVVHNVSALSLGVMSRLRASGVDIDGDLAEKLATFLRSQQGEPWDAPSHADSSNWPYSVAGKRANDLLHETFIIEGLAWYDGASMPVLEAIDGVLRVHYNAIGTPSQEAHTLGSLGWGPPAGLYILTGSPVDSDRVDAIARQLLDSIDGSGRSVLVPENDSRALAWYSLGLARYGANQAGKKALEPWVVSGG
ncbi:MAG: hypothetical protein ABFS14_10235 [Gemmatimonadota bacterium]